MHSKILFLLGMLLCTQAIAANIDELKADDTVSDRVVIGTREIQLPSGVWHVVARSRSEGTDSFGHASAIRNVTLAQYRKSDLIALLRIVSPLGDMPAYGRDGWKDNPCGNLKDTYTKDNLDGSFKLPECVYVKPVFGFGSSSGSYWQDAMRRIQSAGVSSPPVMIYADYNYFRSNGFIHVSVWLNPELAGVARDATRSAIDSKWGVDNLEGPYKKFADQAGAWAREMAAVVKSSYNGTPRAIPELPYMANKQ